MLNCAEPGNSDSSLTCIFVVHIHDNSPFTRIMVHLCDYVGFICNNQLTYWTCRLSLLGLQLTSFPVVRKNQKNLQDLGLDPPPPLTVTHTHRSLACKASRVSSACFFAARSAVGAKIRLGFDTVGTRLLCKYRLE